MDYLAWQQDIFGQDPDSDPVRVELSSEIYSSPPEQTLAHIDRMLEDAHLHVLFSESQIGIGLQLIYLNTCSNICFAYIQAREESYRTKAIQHLKALYKNFFDRYCRATVYSIGNDHLDDRIAYLCYMFWDAFILCPENASESMRRAALEVMAYGLNMKNDNCIVSAIHGLGHWGIKEPRAIQILQIWLQEPSTSHPNVIAYAHQATTGCIL